VTIVLVGLSAIPVAFIAVMLSQPWYVSRGQPELVLIAIFGPLLGIWTVLGVGLLRGFPITPTTDAVTPA
jgi:hypothetical protein